MKQYQVDKIRALSEAIKNILNEYYLDVRSDKKLNQLIELFENAPWSTDIPNISKGSFIIPIEEPKEYELKARINGVLEATDYLIKNDVSVGSFDSSYYSIGSHLMVSISMVSVGAWYSNYASTIYGDYFRAYGEVEISDNIDLQIRIKEHEREAIKEVISRLNGGNKIILFDESFNCSYTLSWSHEKREALINQLIKNIRLCMEEKVVPIAVFYTRSKDMIRGLSVLYDKNYESIFKLTDAAFFSRYLSKVGSRSPLFRVHSLPLRNRDIDLVTFYMKVDGGSVIRIEFPSKFIDKVDIIQASIFSQAKLGNGFPLAIERAHEIAVIKREHREVIETLIANYLGKPSIEYLLSKKELSKRRPVA